MLVEALFRRVFTSGELELIDQTGRRSRYGHPGGRRVAVCLRDAAIGRRLLLNPALALGEGYMDGRILVEEGDIYDFLDLAADNLQNGHPGWGAIPWASAYEHLLRRVHQYNSRTRSRRNIAHHYDLSGELYALFLDGERQYTCAYHPTGTEDLDTAQRLKERHIAAKLRLEPGMRVLDFGCGWGSLAFYLARRYNVDVTGVTLSREQVEWGNARAGELGLAHRVRLLHRDYREVEGRFDRLVSISMLEHVGLAFYELLFRRIKARLVPDGVAVVHSIGRMAGPSYTNGWIRKYIFPGGYIPALSEVLPAIERSRLWATDIEILRLHYAHTLRQWRQRFLANRARAAALYDERFCRMWEYYLAASEVFFRVQDGMNFQIQLAPDRHTLPLARDYMIGEEREAARAARQAAA
jgi:cyclopropane-fatty-acyl-phospholipid synthase